jgi:hypothetical protein
MIWRGLGFGTAVILGDGRNRCALSFLVNAYPGYCLSQALPHWFYDLVMESELLAREGVV